MSKINFLELKQWNANHSSVWREIVSRFGQADYDDESIRKTREETLKGEWDAKKYQRDRASAYPSYADQLDTIYHQGIDGWKAEIKKVKDAHPKPT